VSETVSQETKAEPSGRSLRDRPITPSKSSFQTQEFERIFEQFDLNGDGTLTADEVREVLAVTGMGLSGADRTKLLDRISTGSPLAKQDFLEWLAQREDLDLEADLRTVFALVDQDASGDTQPSGAVGFDALPQPRPGSGRNRRSLRPD
jgi:Ca2+-binding EF-hand superfamily protein